MRHKTTDPTRTQASPETGDNATERRVRRLEAFVSGVRELVARVAVADPRVEDLADSFPGLLFALATDYGSKTARRKAMRAVMAGRPLRESADLLQLPFWLRRLPPQAFQHPLAPLPDDPALANRLASMIPQQPGAASAWLERIAIAYKSGGSDLALWTAHQYRGTTPRADAPGFLRTQAWCWFAGQRELRGEQLLSVRWKPGMGARRAAQEATLWAQRIELDACLGQGIRDTWLAEGHALGFDFVALRTADDFIAEAFAMDNCLDRYADRLANRAVRVFSIRRDGRPVADVEIGGHEREFGAPSITQLRLPRNRQAPMEIWQATYAWLGSQPIRRAEATLQIKVPAARRRKHLDAIWRPYLDVLPADACAALEQAIMPPTARSRRRVVQAARATSLPSSASAVADES